MLLTKQYDNKPVNKCVTRLKMNAKAVNMAGGENVLALEVVMYRKWFDLAQNRTDEEKAKLPNLRSEAFEATRLIMGLNDNKF